MADELNVITHTYDLLLWTMNHTARFPRSHRHGLGHRIEHKLQDLMDALIEAKYTADKADSLRRAALCVEQLRLQFRLAKDLRILAINSHQHAIRRLLEIGKQLGGWRRRNTRTAAHR